MGKSNKVDPVVEVVEDVEHVTVNLDRDPNDPRNFPVVDGNSQPDVDINEPVVEDKK